MGQDDTTNSNVPLLSVEGIGRMISNVGLPSVIVFMLAVYLIPPVADLVRANTVAIPVQTQALKDTATAIEMNAQATEKMAQAVESQSLINKEFMAHLKESRKP